MIHEAPSWVPREGNCACPDFQPFPFSVGYGMHLVSTTPARSGLPTFGRGLSAVAEILPDAPAGIGSLVLRDRMQRLLASALGCAVVVRNSACPADRDESSGNVGCFWVQCYADEHNGELWRVAGGMRPPGRGPEDLEELGLSKREAEVLFWIAQGKTNPEIAVILGIARRTVAMHVEHILGKLTVENRCAAARCASEVLFR